MRASPDLPRLPAVMDAAGRLLPFDRGRFAASLRRALLGDDELASDLTPLAVAWLTRPEQGPVVGLAELGALAARVLEAGGAGWAAPRFRPRVRAGGRDAGAGGRPDTTPVLPADALPADPLAALAGDAGPAAEGRLARSLLATQVRRSLLGDAVRLAEASGLLNVSGHVGGACVPGATLTSTWLERHRGPELGAELRRLARLVTGELRVPWPGRPPTRAELRGLGRHLESATPGSSLGKVVLLLPARHAAAVLDLAQRQGDRPAPALRLVGPIDPALPGLPDIHDQASAQPQAQGQGERPAPAQPPAAVSGADIDWIDEWPAAGVEVGAATLDLPAVAAAAGQRVGPFLGLVEELADEALGALASLAAAGLGAAARTELQPHAGDQVGLSLVLAGAPDVPACLLTGRGDELSSDLHSALGERLRRTLGRSRLPAVLALPRGEGWPAHSARSLARLLGLPAHAPCVVPAPAASVVSDGGGVAPASSSSLTGTRPCA